MKKEAKKKPLFTLKNNVLHRLLGHIKKIFLPNKAQIFKWLNNCNILSSTFFCFISKKSSTFAIG